MEENNSLSGINPVFKSFAQLLTLVGMYLVFAILAAIVGLQVAEWVTGESIQQDMTQVDFSTLTAKSIWGYKIFQLIASVGSFIVTALVFARFFANEKMSEFLGVRELMPAPKVLGLVIVIALSAMPVLSYIVHLNQLIPLPASIEETAKNLQSTNDGFNKAFLQAPSIGVLLFNIFLIAIVPSIGEELLFRGAFMQLFYRFFKQNIHLSIIVVAILFSIMHLQYYNFFAIVLMGVIFGYLYYWSGNIMVAIWAHFINNGVAVLFAYFGEQYPNTAFFKYEYEFSLPVVGISAIVLVGAIVLFYNTTKQYHATIAVSEETDIEKE